MEGLWSDTKDARRCIQKIHLKSFCSRRWWTKWFWQGVDLCIVVKCWSRRRWSHPHCSPSHIKTPIYPPSCKNNIARIATRDVLKVTVTCWNVDGELEMLMLLMVPTLMLMILMMDRVMILMLTHCVSLIDLHSSQSVCPVCPTHHWCPGIILSIPTACPRPHITWQKARTTPASQRDPNISVILSSSAYPELLSYELSHSTGRIYALSS